MTANKPTLVTVPCFSGAPWDAQQLAPLSRYSVRTMRLPEGLDDVEAYADFVAAQVADLPDYVLVGDSFGAVISLTLALRQPVGLSGLVLSGGFAANPLPKWKSVAGSTSGHLGEAFYRSLTLRFHAHQLSSQFDSTAEVPHTPADYRRLFIENTPAGSYSARVASVISFDVRDQLSNVTVPTLLITPADDRLVGERAARELTEGLRAAREVVLPETGHMFRFTHPGIYGRMITEFLEEIDSASAASSHD